MSRSHFTALLAVLFEWLSLTAMRSKKTFSLAWDHVEKDRVRVEQGKGYRTQVLPIAESGIPAAGATPYRLWQHELRRLLDEMRCLHETHRPNVLRSRTRQVWDAGQVFPWNPNAFHPAQALKRAKSDLGWDPEDGRAVHTLRATADTT